MLTFFTNKEKSLKFKHKGIDITIIRHDNQPLKGDIMVSEYNVRPFGLNVIPDKNRTLEQTGKTIENALGNLWEPVLDYLKQNENVFSGDIASQIQKLNMQTMQLGTIVNGAQERRNLNIQS